MSLFDEWQAKNQRSAASVTRGRLQSDGYSSDEDEKYVGVSNSGAAALDQSFDQSDDAIFKVVQMEWLPSREQGGVVSVSAGNLTLLIGTENCTAVRITVKPDGGLESQEDIPISKRPEDQIHRVFLDPTGRHALISLTNGTNIYLSAMGRAPKPVVMQKVKGIVVESVGWHPGASEDHTTHRILLGTTKGLIFETVIENEKDKYLKKLYDLNEVDSKEAVPISGLHIEQFPATKNAEEKFFVMAATPTRHYQFIGGPSFEAMFQRYASTPAFVELPGDLGYSELRFFSPYPRRFVVSETCAWMTGAGIYYGKLSFGSQDQPGDRVVDDGKLLAYPEYPDLSPPPSSLSSSPHRRSHTLTASSSFSAPSSSSSSSTPVSLALTEFHFLLLMRNRLVAINRLSEEIVFEQVFDVNTYGELKGLVPDPHGEKMWVFSQRYVFEVDIWEESRDAWKLFLQQGDFSQALHYADTASQRELVLNAQADHDFSHGHYTRAAETYAKTSRSFEEIALKFVQLSQRDSPSSSFASASSTGVGGGGVGVGKDALKTFLLAKLQRLRPTDTTQQFMLCTWLTEIFLDNLNQLEDAQAGGLVPPALSYSPYPTDSHTKGLSGSARLAALEEEEQAFRDFMERYSDCFNKETSFELIASHGRNKELLFFAEMTEDFDWLLNHHCQQKRYRQALSLLSSMPRPSLHADFNKYCDLFYKFAPILIVHLPKELIELLIQIKGLSSAKLIPALMRYQSVFFPSSSESKESKGKVDSSKTPEGENQSIRYLEAVVSNGNKDPTVHNYLISLYAQQHDDFPLLKFIESYKRPYYDYKYALRVCHQHKKLRACVGIYTTMGLYEDAVKLALSVDTNLAKQVVRRVTGSHRMDGGSSGGSGSGSGAMDSEDSKRLWLLVARSVIEKGENVGKAMAILKECGLKFEDVLPFFPERTKIGDFKDEVIQSLEAYNINIERLKEEMDEYTKTANFIRQDISSLRHRSSYVTANRRCDVCITPVLTRAFYLFPCHHVFHADCLIHEAETYLHKHPRVKEQVLLGDDDPSRTVERDLLTSSSSSTAPSSLPTLPASPASSVSSSLISASLTPSALSSSSSLLPSASSAPSASLPPSSAAASSTPSSSMSMALALAGAKEREREREREAQREREREMRERERKAVEAFANSECPFCGQIMIDSVHAPFVSLPEEKEEVASWEIFSVKD